MVGTIRHLVVHIVILITVAFLILPSITVALGAEVEDQDLWPMYGGNAQHTSLSPVESSGNKGGLAWKFQTNGSIESSPAVDANGTIYFGSSDKTVYALNPNGTLKWKYATTSKIVSSPAIAKDGTIYVAATMSDELNYENSSLFSLYAFEPDGTVKWTYHTGAASISSPTIGPDGTIYICTFFGGSVGLQAINPNGTLEWQVQSWNEAVSTPAVSSDGTIYFGAYNTGLYSIDHDGSTNWNWAIPRDHATSGWSVSSPSIGSDGTIYFGSASHYIYALSPDMQMTGNGENGSMYASPKWYFETSGVIISTPAIGKDGTIYVGSMEDTNDQYHQDSSRSGEFIGTEQNLYALNPDGSLKWKFLVEGSACSSPSISADGTIYFCDWSGHLYALDENGTLRWRYGPISATGPWGPSQSSPAIGVDGTIYVNDGRAICAINQGAPSSPENVQSTRSPGKVTVTWSAPSTDGGYPITAYNVFRTANYENDSYEFQKYCVSVAPSVRSFVDEDVMDNCSYSYLISCNNSVGESGLTYGPYVPPLQITDHMAYLPYVAIPIVAGVVIFIWWRRRCSN